SASIRLSGTAPRTVPASVPELPDERLQLVGHARQLLRGLLRGADTLGRALRGRGDAVDVLGDLGGAARRLLDVAPDLARGGRLLLDGRRDRHLDLVDPTDDLADLADRRDRGLGLALDGLDLRRDLLGRLAGLGG